MANLAFDTLKYTSLKKGEGVPETQAEVQTELKREIENHCTDYETETDIYLKNMDDRFISLENKIDACFSRHFDSIEKFERRVIIKLGIITLVGTCLAIFIDPLFPITVYYNPCSIMREAPLVTPPSSAQPRKQTTT